MNTVKYIVLLVGKALGLVVALEGVLGLVHESRHCDSSR
jgi:hypothetical protein